MKSNFTFLICIFFMHISVFFNVNADDQFNFDVTEIQISENGNKIIGIRQLKKP